MDEVPTNALAAFIGASNNIQSNRLVNAMIGSGADADYNRVLATSLNDESPVRNVLSEDGQNQIKTRKFTKDDEYDTCPIFHIPFEIGDDVKELPCGHIFTPDGIDKWLNEEKAECPVCRFKLESKEIRREGPGVEEWNDDREQLIASRNALAVNLRRLTFPRLSSHPFGPSSHRIANVVHEDDDHDDVMRALAMTFTSPSVFNNVVINHTSGGNISYPSIISNISRNINNTNNTSLFSSNVYDITDTSIYNDNSTNLFNSSSYGTRARIASFDYDLAQSSEDNILSADEPSSQHSVSSLEVLDEDYSVENNADSSQQDNQNTFGN